MSRYYAQVKRKKGKQSGWDWHLLSLVSWILFAIASTILMEPYVLVSLKSAKAVEFAMTMVHHCFVLAVSASFFGEHLTKVHQAKGNKKLPMFAPDTGAATNIVLDPVLIFEFGFYSFYRGCRCRLPPSLGRSLQRRLRPPGFKKPPCLADVRFHFAKRILSVRIPFYLHANTLCGFYRQPQYHPCRGFSGALL